MGTFGHEPTEMCQQCGHEKLVIGLCPKAEVQMTYGNIVTEVKSPEWNHLLGEKWIGNLALLASGHISPTRGKKYREHSELSNLKRPQPKFFPDV